MQQLLTEFTFIYPDFDQILRSRVVKWLSRDKGAISTTMIVLPYHQRCFALWTRDVNTVIWENTNNIEN